MAKMLVLHENRALETVGKARKTTPKDEYVL